MIGLFFALAMLADPVPAAPAPPPHPPVLYAPPLVRPAPVSPMPAPLYPREVMEPTAPPPPEAVRYATLLDVVAAPKQADFTALYPADDPPQITGASVSVNCAVKPDGVLTDCRMTSRFAVDARFGRATLAITAFYRLRPLTAAERKAWPADKERRFRTSITWSRSGSGVTGVPTLPLPKPSLPQPATGEPIRVAGPDWARRPGGDDLARYYPDAAARQEIGGRSTVLCQVTGEGWLELCRVETETPVDMGFGDASLKLTRLFRLRPLTGDGRPVEGFTIRLPIVWSVPE